MIKNRLLQTFLTDEKINKLYLSYVAHPSQHKKDMIEKLFQIHVRKIQLLTYFSKTLHFEAQKFDKKIRHLSQTNPLILDRNVNNREGISLDFIEESQFLYEYNSLVNSYDLEFIFEDKHLYKIISELSTKQKKILYLLYVDGLTEIEIAQRLNITKQAVNKTKHQTLKKIKKDYKKGAK